MANTRARKAPQDRQPARKRPAANAKPHNGMFDLDALEAEAAEQSEPFRVNRGGEVFTLVPFHRMDAFQAREIMAYSQDQIVGMPVNEQVLYSLTLLELLLGDQFEAFKAHGSVEIGSVNALFEAWAAHYGVPDSGDSDASPTS